MGKLSLEVVFVQLIFLSILISCKTKDESRKESTGTVSSEAKLNVLTAGISIHEAALNGRKDLVISLLNQGIIVDTLDVEGRTALMYASYNGHFEIIRTLLEKGADVNLSDSYGRTALMMASSGPYKESVRLLLEQSANPNIIDREEHFTALMYAAAEGQMEVVKLLLANNADPSLKDVDGDNAITFAKNNGHNEVAALLQSFVKK